MKSIVIPVLLIALLSLSCGDSATTGSSGTILRDRTIDVPSEIGTLKAAVAEAKNGDSIVLAPGVYSGDGFSEITFDGKTMIITCPEGPDSCMISLGGSASSNRRAFSFTQKDNAVLIDGITFTGGYFSNGGVANITSVSPAFRNCIFVNNTGTVSGGAVWIKGKQSKPLFINCTFMENQSRAGSAIFCLAGASPEFENCLITENAAAPIYISDVTSTPLFSCTNIFGNENVDWDEDIITQLGQNGNLSVDPGICGDIDRGYRLDPGSPMLPNNNDCHNLIGANGDTCLTK